jgi:hypothetical protein
MKFWQLLLSILFFYLLLQKQAHEASAGRRLAVWIAQSACSCSDHQARAKTRDNPDRGRRVPARSRAVCLAGQCVCISVGADDHVGVRVRITTVSCKDQIAADISCYRTLVQKHQDTVT